MSTEENIVDKEFKPSTWAINNRSIVYMMIVIFLLLGITAYYNMPREDFPEVKDTKVYVNSIYPGNTAEDIERLITDPLEEVLKNVSHAKEINSSSQEDYSIIEVEFDDGITIEDAKQKVKDEVDSKVAGEDWPIFNGAKVEPNIFDLNISEEFPIININLKGDYPREKIKEYAEYLQDRIETLPEIKKADIRGAQDLEVQVDVDIYKMTASKVSFQDILDAIVRGNSTISAGNMIASGQRRTIRVLGEIQDPKELLNFVVKNENGPIYLRDIATIKFAEGERTTYAREKGDAVVMIEVKKRSGSNTVEAAGKVKQIVEQATKNYLPKDLEITYANDQTSRTLNQVSDLVNNIIFGVILVVTVLLFFLGFRNALFVGFAIPMSMFMSFMILQALGYTMNTMVLFGLIMGLGMLVDNGIVVVENVYRLMDEEKMSRKDAARLGIGEIAFPIIISTMTTVAAFIPLGFWPGVMGKFMIFFPITLSIVLGSSLFVALFINSMLVSQFMDIEDRQLSKKSLVRLTLILGLPGLLTAIFFEPMRGVGVLMVMIVLLFWGYRYFIKQLATYFQRNILVRLENFYERSIKYSLTGYRPYFFLIGTILLLFFTFFLVGISAPKTEFFPDNTPNQIIVYIEYPQGTDIEKTNHLTKEVEQQVYEILYDSAYYENGSNFMVDATISQVGMGAYNPFIEGGGDTEMPNRAKITANLREFKYRRNSHSSDIIDTEQLRVAIQNRLADRYPGVIISVEKDPVGPPTGYPITLELYGEDYGKLIQTAEKVKEFINERKIDGIDQLKINVNRSKPIMEVDVDRKKAGELGVSTGQVGIQLRRSIFGEKAGVYKNSGEDYNIYVRFKKDDRYNTSALFNQNITFRDPSNGRLKEIPIAAMVTQRNTASFSTIKHRNNQRVVTVYSDVIPGYNATEVVGLIDNELADFKFPQGMEYKFAGEIEDQEENQAFLNKALGYALLLIFLLLVIQFNSISKPLIIMLAVFLSFIGVFLGLIIFNMTFVIMMTMMGIISLAGIVVNNGVVLLDYTQLLIDRRRKQLGLQESELLPLEEVAQAIMKGGRARLRPVLLTAITTILGLVPLAVGVNIDFFGLFQDFDPQFYIGGDNVIFWGPLAWTVIFGLTFATFLTLIIVPVTFLLITKLKYRFKKNIKSVSNVSRAAIEDAA